MLVDFEINTIPDVIAALQERLDFFKGLKQEGFRLMEPINDHNTFFEPPDSEDEYWVQCKSGECYLKVPSGELPPQECPECKKKVYEFEG